MMSAEHDIRIVPPPTHCVNRGNYSLDLKNSHDVRMDVCIIIRSHSSHYYLRHAFLNFIFGVDAGVIF